MYVYSVQMYTVQQQQKTVFLKKEHHNNVKAFLQYTRTMHPWTKYSVQVYAHLQVYLTGTNSGALTQFVGVLAGSFLSVTIYT